MLSITVVSPRTHNNVVTLSQYHHHGIYSPIYQNKSFITIDIDTQTLFRRINHHLK